MRNQSHSMYLPAGTGHNGSGLARTDVDAKKQLFR
jgi:hypothetical protein